MKKPNFQLLLVIIFLHHQSQQLKVRFFHPAGPSLSFSFPRRLDELAIRHAQVLIDDVKLGTRWVTISFSAFFSFLL